MMPAVRSIGILFFALAAGCAGVKEAPPDVMAQTGPLLVDPSLAESSQDGAVAVAPPPAGPHLPVMAVMTENETNGLEPVAATPTPPTLDVAGLTARLRETKAIGVFTKLALKGQVDDLLKQFRIRHQSGQKSSVASLRQPYDMMVFKVLAAVQDGDPSLGRTISGSCEAMWNILADAERFKSVT